MANPVVTSVTFDKTAYNVGDTITATILYTVPNTHASSSSPVTFTLNASVKDRVTSETGSGTGTFAVNSSTGLVANLADASVSGGQPSQVWTLVSDDHAGRAVFTAKALDPGGSPPSGGGGTSLPATAPVYTLSALDRSQTPQMSALRAGSNDSGASVRQEVWNLTSSLHKQVTEVWSPKQWRTTINAATGNSAVLSYPDVSSLVTDTSNKPIPFANYASITSSWSVDCHENAQTNAQAAYDIWLNNYGLELMIWVDTHGKNLGRLPAGSDTNIDVTFDGVVYDLWASGDNSVVSFVRQQNAKTGSIDIYKVIQYLVNAKRYPATVGVNMFCFGFEVPSTGGMDEAFEVYDYSLVTTAVSGKTI